jgi:hypothetical protein
MKAWLRTVMAVLFTGGLVYLVLEEKHKRKENTIRFPVDENTKDLITRMRAEIAQSLERENPTEIVDSGSEDAMSRLVQSVRELRESQQHLIDEHDTTMVALGNPDLARDPLNAEFRLAIERKKSK